MSVDAHIEKGIGERLKRERKRLAKTQSEIADAVGVRREMWARYEAGTEPGAFLLARAAEQGVDVTFVLTGREIAHVEVKSVPKTAESLGSSRREAVAISREILPTGVGKGTAISGRAVGDVGKVFGASHAIDLIEWDLSADAALVLPVMFGESKTRREFQVIPRLKAEASAGPGMGNAQDATLEAAGIMALDRRWMFDNFGRAGEGFATVQVHGDSMEPTLFNGETIVIDTKVNRIDVSGIYVIQAGADVLVKRVQRKFDGTLVLKSDNAAYEPETLSPAEAKEVQVKGRMVWPRVR